jgi:hypothetical protein
VLNLEFDRFVVEPNFRDGLVELAFGVGLHLPFGGDLSCFVHSFCTTKIIPKAPGFGTHFFQLSH